MRPTVVPAHERRLAWTAVSRLLLYAQIAIVVFVLIGAVIAVTKL